MIKNTDKDTRGELKQKVGKFFLVGTFLALFNFGLYTILARTVFRVGELLWLSVLISSSVATVLAYILHSKITWRGQGYGKVEIAKFMAWNGFEAVVINPILTWLFGLLTGLYQFAFGLSSFLGLPFDYNFVRSTGAFGLMTAVIMVLNFLCYDKLIFRKK